MKNKKIDAEEELRRDVLVKQIAAAEELRKQLLA